MFRFYFDKQYRHLKRNKIPSDYITEFSCFNNILDILTLPVFAEHKGFPFTSQSKTVNPKFNRGLETVVFNVDIYVFMGDSALLSRKNVTYSDKDVTFASRAVPICILQPLGIHVHDWEI